MTQSPSAIPSGLRRLAISMGLIATATLGAPAAETAAKDRGKDVSRDLAKDLAALPVVDEVKIASDAPEHRFIELPRAGVSRIETHAGAPCRVLTAAGDAKAFAVRMGEGKGLTARGTYVLEVEFAEDAPRTFFILNRGENSFRGISCGTSLPDGLQRYTTGNHESIDLPLSGKTRTWRSMFRLHDRFAADIVPASDGTMAHRPEDGFWVIVCQAEEAIHPGSTGAAIASIRLRSVEKPESFDLPVHRPPAGIPQRHLFWREEMADGIVASPDAAKRGLDDPIAWYADKVRNMRFLGIDTFAKDMLEFGHNQGWDSAPYGGSDWVNQTPYPDRWEKIVSLMGKEGIPIMPYYEYCGSIGAHGLGPQKRSLPLYGKKDYTHISWTENVNADVTDPDTREDFAKVVDCTVLKLKDRAKFLGIWLRPRSSQLPFGFGDATLARFASKANHGEAVTREQLRADDALRQRYYDWWFDERRDFLVDARERMIKAGLADPLVLYTCFSGEQGPDVKGDAVVVRGDVAGWKALMAAHPKKLPVLAFDEVVSKDAYLASVLGFVGTWGDWEWQHAIPPADPKRYVDTPGVLMTYPYNRIYSVASTKAFDAFRGKAGLAIEHHSPLDENVIPKELVGYFCSDNELSGPACMYADVLAMANGDPDYIASLNGMTMTRGFPEYVRPFNAAFLSLPALPSERVADGASNPDVVVRRIDGGKEGVWLAVCNTALEARPAVTIHLPKGMKKTVDAATEESLKTAKDTLPMDLPACSLRALHCSQ